jgi:CDP-diacylglycerol--glycerol-3-phosphate 3-phosphatidyltransferase
MAGRMRGLWIVTCLTILRFPLILIFFVLALVNAIWPAGVWFMGAFTALVLSALTDLFDGQLARRFNVETQFGAHADPLMDKFFYLATLPLLVFVALRNEHLAHAIILLVMTLTFLTRDQWVTFLRSIGAIYQVSGKAHWSGKLRTGLNFPLLGAIYVHEESPVALIPFSLVLTFEIIALVVNFVSAFTYTRSYWPYVRRAAELKPEGDRAA